MVYDLTTAMLEAWARMCSAVANAFGPDAYFSADGNGTIRVSVRYENPINAKMMTKRFRDERVYSSVDDKISRSLEMQGSQFQRLYNKSISAEQRLVLAQEKLFTTGVDDGSVLMRQSEFYDILEKGQICENRISILHGVRFINSYFRIGLVTYDDGTRTYILNTKQLVAAAQRA